VALHSAEKFTFSNSILTTSKDNYCHNHHHHQQQQHYINSVHRTATL